jgi:hypothetical protein
MEKKVRITKEEFAQEAYRLTGLHLDNWDLPDYITLDAEVVEECCEKCGKLTFLDGGKYCEVFCTCHTKRVEGEKKPSDYCGCQVNRTLQKVGCSCIDGCDGICHIRPLPTKPAVPEPIDVETTGWPPEAYLFRAKINEILTYLRSTHN